MITLRPITPDELEQLRELDVSEEGGVRLRALDGQVVATDCPWRRQRWDAAECARRIAELRARLDAGDAAYGAFDDAGRLIGLGIYQPQLAAGLSCLRGLWVSRPHRRQGIATALTQQMAQLTRRRGLGRMYVSACPSESAVGFYRSQGFELTDAPHPEMLALEPDDIHMVLDVGHDCGGCGGCQCGR